MTMTDKGAETDVKVRNSDMTAENDKAEGSLWELTAQAEDVEQWIAEVARLEGSVFEHSAWNAESFRRAAENVYDCLFLYTDEAKQLLGYALLRRLDVAELLIIGVAKEARRRGIGAALMEKVRSAAGGLPVFLEVREGNAAARRLYETCGFREYGRRKNYYEHPAEDAVLMKYEDTINA